MIPSYLGVHPSLAFLSSVVYMPLWIEVTIEILILYPLSLTLNIHQSILFFLSFFSLPFLIHFFGAVTKTVCFQFWCYRMHSLFTWTFNAFSSLGFSTFLMDLFSWLQHRLRETSLAENDAFNFLKGDSSGDCIRYSAFCQALRQVLVTSGRINCIKL